MWVLMRMQMCVFKVCDVGLRMDVQWVRVCARVRYGPGIMLVQGGLKSEIEGSAMHRQGSAASSCAPHALMEVTIPTHTASPVERSQLLLSFSSSITFVYAYRTPLYTHAFPCCLPASWDPFTSKFWEFVNSALLIKPQWSHWGNGQVYMCRKTAAALTLPSMSYHLRHLPLFILSPPSPM